ncbi:nitrogen fixation protein NifR, partial [Staphylococcus aureus]
AFFNSSQGPQHREFRKEILQAMQVGVGQRNKFCENIISVPLPRLFWIMLHHLNDFRQFL